MSYHTPAPWPVAGRVALALVLAGSVVACTEEEQQSTDAVLAVFGVTGVEPPSYGLAVAPEPVAEPAPAPKPECRPVFRVVECVDGEEVWL